MTKSTFQIAAILLMALAGIPMIRSVQAQAPAGSSAGGEQGFDVDIEQAKDDVQQKQREADAAAKAYFDAKKRLENLQRPKPDQPPPPPQVVTDAQNEFDRKTREVTEKTLALTAAKKRLAFLQLRPPPAPAPAAVPQGGAIAKLQMGLGPSYYEAKRLRATLRGSAGLNDPMFVDPRLVRDPFDVQMDRYREHYVRLADVDFPKLPAMKPAQAVPIPQLPTQEPVTATLPRVPPVGPSSEVIQKPKSIAGTTWADRDTTYQFKEGGVFVVLSDPAAPFDWRNEAGTWSQNGNSITYTYRAVWTNGWQRMVYRGTLNGDEIVGECNATTDMGARHWQFRLRATGQ